MYRVGSLIFRTGPLRIVLFIGADRNSTVGREYRPRVHEHLFIHVHCSRSLFTVPAFKHDRTPLENTARPPLTGPSWAAAEGRRPLLGAAEGGDYAIASKISTNDFRLIFVVFVLP